MKKNIFYSVLLLTLLISGCTEKIDLDLDTSSIKLVVEGNITDQPGPYMVRIATTAPYYADGRLPVVTGAAVTVSDGDSVITLSEQVPGDYYTPAGFTGVPGKTYTLQIDLQQEIAGERHYTAIAPMPLKHLTDSISVEYRSDWYKGGWQIKLYALDPPGPNAYLFRPWQNGVLIDSLTRWTAVDDQFFDGNYVMGIGVIAFFKERNQIINYGDSIALEVFNITNDYQTFIENMQYEVEPRNPLFAPPPSNVPGNISNGGIGYFAAYPVHKVYTVYTGSSM